MRSRVFFSPLKGGKFPPKIILQLFFPLKKNPPSRKNNKNTRRTLKAKKARRRRRWIYVFFPLLQKMKKKPWYIHGYIKMCTTNFMWVLYFQQIGELSNFFQNHIDGMTFSKITPNFTVLKGFFWDPISDLIFFGPSNFYRVFFCKIEGDINFVVNLFFWSDSF